MRFARYSLAVLSLAVAATAGSAPNPLTLQMPPDISSDCNSFLMTLNSDAGLQGCIANILSAVGIFNDTTASFSDGDVQNSFGTLCADDSTSACSTTAIRAQLTDFSTRCSSELENVNTVAGWYDMLYALVPVRGALCTKDASSGAFCATQSTTVGNNTMILGSSAVAILPPSELGALGGASMPFLFVTAATEQPILCSQCFQDVLQVYVTYEGTVPYVMGTNQSPLLQNQGQIWKAFSSQCGDAASGDIAVNAGAAPSSGATPRATISRATIGAGTGAAVLLSALAFF